MKILYHTVKKPVTITGGRYRLNNDNDKKHKSDLNLDDRKDKFTEVINQKNISRILLRYLIDIGLVNFPESLSTRNIFMLIDNYNKLFESKPKVTPIPKPKAEIYFHGTPCILYPQIKLDDNFKVFFN